jgi:osmoprotectant transport system substrate-binding protein
VIRTEKLNHEIGGLLDAVSAKLTTENVTTLVGKVVIDGQDVPSVAKDFLTANDLI